MFERKEEVEIDVEPMEIDTMIKQERLDRMKMRMKEW